MTTAREELHALVEQLPEAEVAEVVSSVRARLQAVPSARSWPPAFFGMAEGPGGDLSARVDEVLAEGFGRSSD
jgi:hypothetical protein